MVPAGRYETGLSIQSFLTLTCHLLQVGNIGGQEQRIATFFMRFLQELNKQVELGQNATDLGLS